jgi:hypothetical protein
LIRNKVKKFCRKNFEDVDRTVIIVEGQRVGGGLPVVEVKMGITGSHYPA